MTSISSDEVSAPTQHPTPNSISSPIIRNGKYILLIVRHNFPTVPCIVESYFNIVRSTRHVLHTAVVVGMLYNNVNAANAPYVSTCLQTIFVPIVLHAPHAPVCASCAVLRRSILRWTSMILLLNLASAGCSPWLSCTAR